MHDMLNRNDLYMFSFDSNQFGWIMHGMLIQNELYTFSVDSNQFR